MRIFVMLLLLAGLAWAQDLSQPEGTWEVAHTDGKVFHIVLKADHSATSDYGKGEKGNWSYDPKTGLTVDWTDGWRDRIFLDEEGKLMKWGWAPGADRQAEPSNKTAARKLN